MPKTYKVKVTLNVDICISCGVCNAIYPGGFEFNPQNNKYKVTKQFENPIVVDEQTLQALQNAANSCPVQAIKVEILEEMQDPNYKQ